MSPWSKKSAMKFANVVGRAQRLLTKTVII